jgi:hypothetical protein
VIQLKMCMGFTSLIIPDEQMLYQIMEIIKL